MVRRLNWTPELAYLVGLIVTDGSLSKDGRHVSFVSKDRELVEHVQQISECRGSIATVAAEKGGEKKYYRLQISSVHFYRWLVTIGLTPNKTKTIGSLAIPDEFFYDFLRGHFDGDGYSYSYFDPRWPTSFLFYINFTSASFPHIHWLKAKIAQVIGPEANIAQNVSTYSLRYGKINSLKLIAAIYYSPHVICLSRKRLKIEEAVQANNGRRDGETVDALA